MGSEESSAQDILPVDVQLCITKRVAIATFWDMLADFVGLRLCPGEWLTQIDAQHPFLGVLMDAEGNMSLVLRRA